MNKLKNNIFGILAVVFALSVTSCGDDFLKEELTSQYSTQYFQTEQGLNDLAVALYGNIRYHFAYEWAYGTTQYGCDEFSTGTDLTSDPWNTYDSRLAPYVVNVNNNTPSPSNLWDQMYYGINSANIIIANQDVFTDENKKNLCVGEAYFLRGYNYLRLVMQYGGVVLKLKPSNTVERYFERSSVEECVASIVSDLHNAYSMLPSSELVADGGRGKGAFTKWAAAHFLAKALLFRCSERNDDWNSSYKQNDLNDIISYCNEVIAARPLAPDYRDLWNWTGIDCPAEMLPEILMSAQFNGDASTAGRFKNRSYCYFPSQFSNYSKGWVKRGQWVGLDFQRCRPTEYNYDVFDKVNDSRFWKSFKTTYNVNVVAVANKGVNLGDLAIMYIVNDKSDTRFNGSVVNNNGDGSANFGVNSFNYVDSKTGHVVPHAFVGYVDGNWVGNSYGNNVFASISKYEDGSRTAEKGDGNRDGVLARTGETYLIKAEALVRQGKYQDAIDVVNLLRARAQYVSGEVRTLHTDGTQAFKSDGTALQNQYAMAYSTRNTYYESTGIAETTAASNLQIASYTALPPEDEAVLSKLGVTSDYDRMLNFILDERTRELDGEFLRWDDLARTKTLVLRAKTFNPQAAGSVSDKHCLRPIPQAFIDGLLNPDGSGLTAAQKAALQNPGY